MKATVRVIPSIKSTYWCPRTLLISVLTVLILILNNGTIFGGPLESNNSRPLESLLQADGTLNLNTGFSGSLETEGWSMVIGSNGEPNFIPTGGMELSSFMESVPGDENWDYRFGHPAGTDGIVNAMVVDGSNLYIGGDFTKVGGVAARGIAKWDGNSWSPLGEGLPRTTLANVIHALALDGNDLYAGGEFFNIGGVSTRSIAKWNGSSWSALGGGTISGIQKSGAPGIVYSIALVGNYLYVGGDFDKAGEVNANNIARWNGSNWSTVGNLVATNGEVRAFAVIGSDLYVGGYFIVSNVPWSWGVAKWDGSSWSSLGEGMIWINPENGIRQGGRVYSLAVRGNELYAGGCFNRAGGIPANNIAKWDGSSWSPLGSGIGSSDNYCWNKVISLAVVDNDIYAGTGNIDNRKLMKWDGQTWSTIGGDEFNGHYLSWVNALAVRGSELYVGGRFITIGELTTENIAKLNGNDWSSFGNGVDGEDYIQLNAIAVMEGELYVGGWFTEVGGLNAINVAKWDGQTWSTLGGGLSGGIYSRVNAFVVNGSELYAGGEFTMAGDIPVSNLAKWDGHNWSAVYNRSGRVGALTFLNNELYVGRHVSPDGHIEKWDGSNGYTTLGIFYGEFYGDIFSLAVIENNLYVGGRFFRVGTVNVNNIAKWDGDSWSALGSGLDGNVFALAANENYLFAGGEFTTTNGLTVNNIAQWDGDNWSALGNGLDGRLRSLAVVGSALYAGGSFTEAGGASASRIAMWDGNTWSALGSGLSGGSIFNGVPQTSVKAIGLIGSDLYVGGDFYYAGEKSSNHIGKWTITQDHFPPLLVNVPSDRNFDCHTIPSPANVTAEDNRDGSLSVVFTETETPGSGCPEVKVITRTWTAEDAAGNVASASQIIRVEDKTSPSITVPTDKTVACGDPTDPSATGIAKATDNCEGHVTITFSDVTNNGTCPEVSIIERTWTATDACGNSMSAEQTIRIVDFLAPMITCPPDLTIESGESTDPTNTGVATATDLCDPTVDITHSDEFVQACGASGIITRTWTATDNCDNFSSCIQTIEIIDTTEPNFTELPSTVSQPNDNGECGAIVVYPNIIAVDNGLGYVDIVTDPLTGSYFDVGITTVTVTATDECGNEETAEFDVEVTNDIPDISPIQAPTDPVEINTSFSVSATSTDNNLLDAWWDWGDGSGSTGIINDGTVSGDHSYAVPGVYTVSLTLTDLCLETFTDYYRYVVVYNSEGGFVTGAGWINSPAGAYINDPELTGKATFGFTSKYVKGSSVPAGNTKFKFKAGDLSFESYEYDWLVVAGDKAKFKGKGTIRNDARNYHFMISAIDGEKKETADKFRIKIWYDDDLVVYDNQLGAEENADPSTEISAGAIAVHDGKGKARIADISNNAEQDLNQQIHIYPNPVKRIVTVEFPSGFKTSEKNIELHLFNLTGVDVMDNHMRTVRDQAIELDIVELPTGIYILTIQNGETTIKHKITKL